MDVASSFPGLTGFFISGIISASLRLVYELYVCCYQSTDNIFNRIVIIVIRVFQYDVGTAEHRVRNDLQRFFREYIEHKSFRIHGKYNHEMYCGDNRFCMCNLGLRGRTTKRSPPGKFNCYGIRLSGYNKFIN